jgi:TonB family protein
MKSGDFARIRDEIQQIDEHLTVGLRLNGTYNSQRNDVTLAIGLLDSARPQTPAGVVRIGGNAGVPAVISQVAPEYTEQARQAKWQGTVALQVTIDENGVPQDIKIVRPLGFGLDQKAIEAVQQWRFKPTLLNGKPVTVSTNIEISFRL